MVQPSDMPGAKGRHTQPDDPGAMALANEILMALQYGRGVIDLLRVRVAALDAVKLPRAQPVLDLFVEIEAFFAETHDRAAAWAGLEVPSADQFDTVELAKLAGLMRREVGLPDAEYLAVDLIILLRQQEERMRPVRGDGTARLLMSPLAEPGAGSALDEVRAFIDDLMETLQELSTKARAVEQGLRTP